MLFNRLGAVYLIRTKDEVADKLLQFIAELGKPRKIVTDNEREFKFGKFAEICLQQGIHQEFTSDYTPEENGKIERIWGTIGAMARCLMKKANLPEVFWSFAYRAAFHIKNRCIHSAHGKTPFEKFFGEVPKVSHLKVFGRRAYMYVEKSKRRKFDSRAREGILLGYSNNSNSYLIGFFEDGELVTKQWQCSFLREQIPKREYISENGHLRKRGQRTNIRTQRKGEL